MRHCEIATRESVQITVPGVNQPSQNMGKNLLQSLQSRLLHIAVKQKQCNILILEHDLFAQHRHQLLCEIH